MVIRKPVDAVASGWSGVSHRRGRSLCSSTAGADLEESSPASRRPRRRWLARGVRVRGLYEQSAVEAPGGFDDLLQSLALGEEARATRGVPPAKWLIVDKEVMITPVQCGGSYSEGLLEVRHPTLVALFVAYFETLWSSAVPLADIRRDSGSPRPSTRMIGRSRACWPPV